jgi:hypothetical protein
MTNHDQLITNHENSKKTTLKIKPWTLYLLGFQSGDAGKHYQVGLVHQKWDLEVVLVVPLPGFFGHRLELGWMLTFPFPE